MEEILKFIKECKTYYLATVDGDEARVRPFGTMEIFEGKLYIQTAKNKEVFKQIERNNNVEICGCKGGEWIRITGKLIADDRIEAKKDMLDKNPYLRGMYSENDDNTIVLYFESGKAIIYSFENQPKVINF